MLETQKEYYENNRDKIFEKTICECSAIVCKRGLARHRKSQKHLKLLEKNNIK